jgi:hypothetical protein
MKVSFFSNNVALIEDLEKKAECYPLIRRLYIPLIEHHENEYPSAEIDDWLLSLWFQFLWLSGNSSWNVEMLNRLTLHEKELEQVYDELGADGLRQLCENLLVFAKHKTVNGVHSKLLDFYGELRGVLHFINNGYKVEIIPRKEGKKTADFFAIKDRIRIVVECKFVRASNPIRTFIERYTRYLNTRKQLCTGFENMRLRPGLFSYGAPQRLLKQYPKDLNSSDIKLLKIFVDQIVDDEKSIHEVDLDGGYTVSYERNCDTGLGLVTIGN